MSLRIGRWPVHFILALFCLLLSSQQPCLARNTQHVGPVAQPLTLPSAAPTPGLAMAYYVDLDGTKTIDNIKQASFTDFNKSKNFGLGKTRVWLRVTPTNVEQDKTYFIYFWATFTDDLRIYRAGRSGTADQLLAVQGDKKNQDNWTSKTPIGPLELRPGPEPAVYYYAVDNDGFTLVDLRIYSMGDFLLFKRDNLIKKATLFGFGLMLMVWILFSRIAVPLRLIVTFIAFLFSVILVIAFGAGDISEIADSIRIDDDTVSKLLLAMTFIWTTLFTVFFLQMLGLRSIILRGVKLLTAGIIVMCVVFAYYRLQSFMAVIFSYFVIANLSCMLLIAGFKGIPRRNRIVITSGYALIVSFSVINIMSFFEIFPVIIVDYNFPLISALFFIGLMLSIILFESNRVREEGRLAQKKLQLEMQEKATIQRINSEQSGLLAMISHEFKNSLAVVSLELSIISSKGTVFKHSPQKIQSLTDIIDNCLLLDQSGQGTLAVNLEPMSCRECLLALLAQDTRFAQIHLDCNPRHYFYVDERIFAILAKNLLENALKYGAIDVPILLRVCMSTDATSDQPTIAIMFSNAIGQFGAPEAGRVFDKFYRAPSALRLSGSGLGLFIVRQLAHLMQGRVDFENTGSRVVFTVHLPGFDADEII